MKKKSKYTLLLLIPFLSACQSTLPLEFSIYQYNQEVKTTFIKENNDNYYQLDNINPLNINKKEGVNIKTGIYSYSSLNDVSQGFDKNNYCLYGNDIDNPNNYVEQNLLVVPVYFTDSSVASNEQLKEDKLTLLKNAFFGEEKFTNYQSVASFYDKSSDGHLKIKGEVLPWMGLEESSNEARDIARKNSPENYSDQVVKTIVDNLSSEILEKYSVNNEGILDSLYIIYDYPYDENKTNNEESLFWAYVYHCKKSEKASVYAWSSFDFVGNDALETHKVNANTYIHETGHLLGLPDFYNKSGAYQPTGFMDMMDYNLGDHSPLSKYLLNWTSPKVLDLKNEQGEITLHSFTESGDFILVPRSDYNNTPYDRYLLISYFTPTHLNASANDNSYIYLDSEGNQRVFTYPNRYGITVYEVNAKLGYYQYNSIRNPHPSYFVGDEDNMKSGDYVINFYYDNEISSSSDKPLVHLLESSGENSFEKGLGASNDTLFTYGMTFGEETFLDLAEEFHISFKVSKVTTKEAKIIFTKK